MRSYDCIVIGAGVIGMSVAFHLNRLGAERVLVLEQATIGSGTTAQSSGILRTHYSVLPNVQLARAAWQVFNGFAEYIGDAEASCGLVKCGYMVCAPDGPKADALRASVHTQQQTGIDARFVSHDDARKLLPIAQFGDVAIIALETEAGFADAYLVTTSFARAARRNGVKIREGVRVTGLIRSGRRIMGVMSTDGDYGAGSVISTQNVWSASDLAVWMGKSLPVRGERHSVLLLEGEAYSSGMPVFKDLGSEEMMYYRSYGGHQMLASEGSQGDAILSADLEQGEIGLDYIERVAALITKRFPVYETAALASSWTGVYDVTPDWNPVLGAIGDIDGLTVGFGFSGHGFKLSPTVGKLLAQHALGITPEFSLRPYCLERFERGELLIGRYGLGAIS